MNGIPSYHQLQRLPGLYAGNYGWDHAAYWGIAEAKAGVDLKEWYKTRTEAPKGMGGVEELSSGSSDD